MGDIVASAQLPDRSDVATMTSQIFGILSFHYHNTAVFLDNMKEHFIQFNEHRNMAALRAALAHVYEKELQNPSFMFSTCDGIRAPKKSWRDPALTSLAAWFNIAGLMASELLTGLEAGVFFQHFIELYLPLMQQFAAGYRGKFNWFDLEQVRRRSLDLHFGRCGVHTDLAAVESANDGTAPWHIR